MTFRYYVTFLSEEPDKPRTLFTVNRDKEAGRLDMIVYSHITKQWESDPGFVTRFLFKEDYLDRRRAIPREQAQEIARMIGTTLPSEQEMIRISDEAERLAERQRRELSAEGP